jgi:uncharacterized protein YndB with AHSA1/START domain
MITALRAVAARDLPHPAETVFAAWLDGAQLGAWMFAGDHVVDLRAEPVVGGAFTFVVRRGGEVLHHEGRYRRIEPARALSFTWDVTEHSTGAVSTIDVILQPRTDGCAVTVTHHLGSDFDPADLPQREADLGRMLDTLDEHLRTVSRPDDRRPGPRYPPQPPREREAGRAATRRR